MNRYLYVLSVLVDGKWVGKQYTSYPRKEMDKIQENGQIWKLAITKNPYYKEPTENT
jgi:archaellum component FlaG (FlaF/FlaG flagellin family)